MNEAFATVSNELILKTKTNYQIYGHHHHNIHGQTQMLINQLGYIKMMKTGFLSPEVYGAVKYWRKISWLI